MLQAFKAFAPVDSWITIGLSRLGKLAFASLPGHPKSEALFVCHMQSQITQGYGT